MVGGYSIDRSVHEQNLKQLAESAALAEASPAGLVIAGASGSIGEATAGE